MTPEDELRLTAIMARARAGLGMDDHVRPDAPLVDRVEALVAQAFRLYTAAILRRGTAAREALIRDFSGYVGSDDAEYARATAERAVDRALLAGCRGGLPPGAFALSRAQLGLLKLMIGGFLGGMGASIGEKGRQDYLDLTRRNCKNLLFTEEETADFMRLLGDGG